MIDVLGVDVDGPIVSLPPQRRRPTLTQREFEACLSQAGCFKHLNSLAAHGWRGRVYLFGVTDEIGQGLFSDWLKRSGFSSLSIGWDHIVWLRTVEEFRTRCAGLSIVHFIGHDAERLAALVGTVPNLYWFKPTEHDRQTYQAAFSRITIVENWRDAEDRLRHATLPLPLDNRFFLRTRWRP